MRTLLLGLLSVVVGATDMLGQSDVAFPPAVYAARRVRLMQQAGDAAVIVPGRYLVGAHDLPKQDPNFWYLTGVESPYAILVMLPATGQAKARTKMMSHRIGHFRFWILDFRFMCSDNFASIH